MGSLDSCDTEIQNITVTRNIVVPRNISVNVTEVTPLAAVVVLDGSGSMCWDSDFDRNLLPNPNNECNGYLIPPAQSAACTTGVCSDEVKCYCASNISSCVCDEDRWSQAKIGIEYLNMQLNTSMNFGVNSSSNKLQTGIITYSYVSETFQDDYLKINAPLTSGIAATNAIAENMALQTGGTAWGNTSTHVFISPSVFVILPLTSLLPLFRYRALSMLQAIANSCRAKCE